MKASQVKNMFLDSNHSRFYENSSEIYNLNRVGKVESVKNDRSNSKVEELENRLREKNG